MFPLVELLRVNRNDGATRLKDWGMSAAKAWVSRISSYFGASDMPHVVEQERSRALARCFNCLALTIPWSVEKVLGHRGGPEVWVIVVGVVYATMSLAYRHVLSQSGRATGTLLYAFVVTDSIILTSAVGHDTRLFGVFNPFLLTIVVGCGIRYGVRTMYLSWAAVLAGLLLLVPWASWRADSELTVSFVFMMMLVPLFFSFLVRQIHEARAIEEDRARLAALQEIAVVRNAFLAKVSHELRSPLQSIVSTLDVFEMRQRDIDPDDRELIGRMRRSSLLLNTQLRDLMTLARGEAGRLQMHPEPFDAVALVEATVASLDELALAKGLALIADLPQGPLFAVADGARIDQILTNLIINSIRYTESGQVRVTLRASTTRAAELRFTIADTGPGIAEDVLATLFDPDKVPTGPARRGEGSGIGLAIVRTLVAHLGGEVAVASQIGRGTTFTVNIPAEPIDAEPAEERDDPGWRVLVIDDRDEVRDALVSVIDELGFECDSVSSSAAGANLLAARRYAAVLLDVQMPVKGGVELAAETRRGDGPNRTTRLIAISAAEWTGDAGNFDACLTKPIDHAALKHALLGAMPDFSRPSQPGLWLDDGI